MGVTIPPGCYKVMPELGSPPLLQRAIWRTWGLVVWFARDRWVLKRAGWRKNINGEWESPV